MSEYTIRLVVYSWSQGLEERPGANVSHGFHGADKPLIVVEGDIRDLRKERETRVYTVQPARLNGQRIEGRETLRVDGLHRAREGELEKEE